MGKNQILDQKQKLILSEIEKDDFLTSEFYFTGGTALGLIYLQHRLSVDLDFFSFRPFDSQSILNRLKQWTQKYSFRITPQFVDPTHIYLLKFDSGQELKVDFAHFPHQPLRPRGLYQKKLKVDSQFDIAVNKLLSISQRVEVKDFVDLYFLLQKYTFWDLRNGVKKKFKIEVEPMTMAANFTAVEDFDYLPKMIKPLKLTELKEFFCKKAKQLGRTGVK